MPHAHRAHPRGVALCLASAVGFGAMAIFAKEAYAGGATIPTLLAVRFTLAAAVLWALLLPRVSRSPVTGRRPGGRPPSLLPGLALGVLYAVEASAWFIALSRIDAALAELLLYAYPALVVVGAALLGVAFLALKAGSFAALARELRFIERTHLTVVAAAQDPRVRQCRPVTLPTYRLIPDLRFELDAPEADVRARSQLGADAPGTALFVVGDEKAVKRFGEAAGVSRRFNVPPATPTFGVLVDFLLIEDRCRGN